MVSVRAFTLVSVALVALAWVTVSAQQSPPSFVPTTDHAPAVYGAPVRVLGLNQDGDLARRYVKSEKEEEKRELRKQLSESLNKQFEQHVKQQQKELEELEKQIAELRSMLRKRQEAKTTIVERRLEQLIQEAEGLGWNAPHAQPTSGFDAFTGRRPTLLALPPTQPAAK